MAETCTCHRPGRTQSEALEVDLEVAQSALREGDLPHARHHVAGAFGTAPTDPRTHSIFEALASRMELTQPPEQGWYGEFAMVAFALHRAGQHGEAMRMLAQVAAVAPHLGYEHILTGWVASASEAVDDAVSDQFAATLVKVLESTIGLHRLRPGEQALLASFAGWSAILVQLPTAGPGLLVASSGVLRRAGRVDEALAVARRTPGVPGRVQEGLALRVRGEGAQASAAFEAAAAEAGEPELYAVDRARCHYVAGNPSAALALLEGASDEDSEVAGLRAACRDFGGDPRSRVDGLDGLRRATGYVALDAPGDATANLLADPRVKESKGLSSAVSGWESPTNRLLLSVLAGHTDVRKVSYTMSFTDFERPVLRGAEPLWVEDRGVVVQAREAPAPELRSAVARAAGAAGGSPMVRLRALVEAARRVKVESAESLLAAMLHPPQEAARDNVAQGVYLYQVACACALTSLPSREGLRALESIILGPVDWASGAAVVALGEWVHREPAVAHQGRAVLLAAIDDLLPHSCEPRFWPLLAALSFLPCVPSRANDTLRAWYRKHLSDEPK